MFNQIQVINLIICQEQCIKVFQLSTEKPKKNNKSNGYLNSTLRLQKSPEKNHVSLLIDFENTLIMIIIITII